MRRSSVIVTIALTVMLSANSAEAKLDLYIDKSTQRMSVVQNGYLLYVWPVSTGRDSFTTPNGIYTPERLERSWFSKAYYNAPMPYAIFFHNGYAIHGSYDIARLGGPASHGCIRLHPQNAARLFAMVEQEGPRNTAIVVGGDSSPYPQSPRRRDFDEFRSAYTNDGEMARGGYPPDPRAERYSQMPPYRPMPPYAQTAPYPQTSPYYDAERFADAPGRRRGDNGQFAMRGPDPGFRPPAPYRDMPYRDMEEPIDPRNGARSNDRVPMRSADAPFFRPPAPRRDAETFTEPGIGMRGSDRAPTGSARAPIFRPPALRRDIEASIEPKSGMRGSDRLPMRSAPAPAVRPPALRRDIEASIEPKAGSHGADRLLVRSADPPILRPAVQHRDAETSVEVTGSLRGGNRAATIKSGSKCPTCASGGEAGESANRQDNPGEIIKPSPSASPPPPASPPSSEQQQQPSPGYKILPKSYWAGASWRWRLKSDQEAH